MEKILQIVKGFVDEAYTAEYNGSVFILFPCHYTPFKEVALDAYYIASKKGIELGRQIIAALKEEGIEATAGGKDVSLKRLAVESGLAYMIGRNGLAYSRAHGSRFFIGAIQITNYSVQITNAYKDSCPPKCALCIKTCPAGAVGVEGPDYAKCLRAKMNHPETMTDGEVRLLGGRVLGCDICQRVCPKNKKEYTDMPPELAEICADLTDEGNLKKLAALVGENIARPERIKRLLDVASLF